MLALCGRDPLMAEFQFDTYEFNTARVRLPFQLRMPSLQQIAAGLASEINIRHKNREKIYLIGHSLGGLVARQYLLSEIKKSNKHKVSGVLLFATPNTGASLASVGNSLSWNQRHLKQLTNGSDILQSMNEDWVHFAVESSVKVKYISGGADAIVEPSSSIPYIGERNSETLIKHDHRSIIMPEKLDDIRYLVLQQFLLDAKPEAPSISTSKPADPLFDIYHEVHEPYYFKRDVDGHTMKQLARRPLWLWGRSGIGKTTSLRHLSTTSGWKIGQIMLSSYQPDAPDVLFRAMCEQLADLQRSTDELAKDADVPSMIGYFRRQLRLSPPATTLCLIIEEIPLSTREKIEIFLGYILYLIQSIESDDSLANRFVLAFSSVYDPSQALSEGMVKLREHLQIAYVPNWSLDELTAFVGELCEATAIDLATSEREMLAKAACGSPRFIKMALRKLRNDITTPLTNVIQSVRVEQV